MWNAWLDLDNKIQWDNEIVVTEAKERKDKNIENYNHLLDLAFSELRRVLKGGKYLSLAFNCLDNNIWNGLFGLFTKYDFKFIDMTSLEYSSTSVVQDSRKNALKNDFILTFQKK